MGTIEATIVYLILLQIPNVYAVKDEEWKTATATYSKETDGSIITEGACGYGDLHKISYGKHSAGLSSMLFSRGSTCGACYELRCVDHILWCLQGSPTVILTATDFCPPNYGLSADYGGWCNFPCINSPFHSHITALGRFRRTFMLPRRIALLCNPADRLMQKPTKPGKFFEYQQHV